MAIALLAACLLLSLSTAVHAESPSEKSQHSTTLGLGLGFLSGNTLYHISSYDTAGSGIESELEFPLETKLLGLEGGYIGRNDQGRETLKINIQWFKNFDNGSGQLKDSDWLTSDNDIALVGAPHPGLDIYSESDIALKANIVDLRASYNFWQSERLAIGPFGGFLYQNYQFDASNVHQVGFGPYNTPAYNRSVSGLVLTYEVTYTILYLGIHTEIPFSRKFQAVVDLGYSPWAAAEDTDDHVLRGKRSTGSTSGHAYLATVTAQWDLENNNFFLVRCQYLNIETSGTQTQTWYRNEVTSSGTIPAGTTITGINDRISSQQNSVLLNFNHRF